MGTPQGAMEGDKKLWAIHTVGDEVTGKQGEPQTWGLANRIALSTPCRLGDCARTPVCSLHLHPHCVLMHSALCSISNNWVRCIMQSRSLVGSTLGMGSGRGHYQGGRCLTSQCDGGWVGAW